MEGLQHEQGGRNYSNVQYQRHRECAHVDRTVGERFGYPTVCAERAHREQHRAAHEEPNPSYGSEEPEHRLEHNEL